MGEGDPESIKANRTKTEVTSRLCLMSGVPCRLCFGASNYSGEMLTCWPADQLPGLADAADPSNRL